MLGQTLMLQTFAAASHDEVLQLVVQIALLLATARVLGEVAQRLRQPQVVGELLAGVLLGPSVLSGLVPAVGRWVLPQTAVQGHLIEVVSLIGVMLLLVMTGLETDLALIGRRAGAAFGIAMGGLLLPFGSGLALGYLLPADLLVDPGSRIVFALFLATALSISAIPVLAKVLLDLDLMKRELGQTMLAAGMVDDITGWTMLAIVTALAAVGSIGIGTVAVTLGSVALFVVLTATAGRFVVRWVTHFTQTRMESRDRMLTLVVVLVFAWGALSQALHLEPVIGAFAIGVLLGRLRRLPADVIKKLSAVTLGVFAPIFFAVAGLKVDVRSLLRPRLIAITLVVLAVATVGKVVGVYVGARWISRQDHWTALAYGFGLNARGAVELIVATIGLSLGILTQEVFSMVVVMAIVTSLMAPFSLRLILRRVEQDPEEARRLRRQEATEGGLLGELHRVLVPIRPRSHPVGPVQTIEAAVLERLGEGAGLGVTLLSVTDPAGRPAAAAHLAEVRSLFDRIGEVTVRVLTAQQPVQAVLREAANDYDLLVIGTPEPSLDADLVFGRFVDDLVKLSPCPTLVVRGWPVTPGWQPRRLLVPADGTGPGRSAAELAFAMAGADSQVTVVHVITPHPSPVMAITDRSRRHRLATEMTGQLLDLGASLEVLTWSDVREAEDVEAGILAAVVDTGADLLVLGTAVRAGTSRLFLGPRVERLLERVPCPVLVLNR